mgnify:CR=1 FL=1
MSAGEFEYAERKAQQFREMGERAFQHASRMTAAGAAGSAISRALSTNRSDIITPQAQRITDPETARLRERVASLAGFILSDGIHRAETTRHLRGQVDYLKSELADLKAKPKDEPIPQIEVVTVPIFIPTPPQEPEKPKTTIDKDPVELDESENPHKDLITAAVRSGVLRKIPQKLLIAKLKTTSVLELRLSEPMLYTTTKTINDLKWEWHLEYQKDERHYKKYGSYPSLYPRGSDPHKTVMGDAVNNGVGAGSEGILTATVIQEDNRVGVKLSTPKTLAGNIIGIGREDSRGNMELTLLALEESDKDVIKEVDVGELDKTRNIFLPTRAWPVDNLEGQIMADILMDSTLRDSEDPKLAAAWRKFVTEYDGKLPGSAKFSINAALSSQPEPEPEVKPQQVQEPATKQSKGEQDSKKEESADPHKAEILKAVKTGAFVKIPEDVVKKMIAKAEPNGLLWQDPNSQRNMLNISQDHGPHMFFVSSGSNITLELWAGEYYSSHNRLLTGIGVEREDGSFALKLTTVGQSLNRYLITRFELDNPETVTNLYAPRQTWHLSAMEGTFFEGLVIKTLSTLTVGEKKKWGDYMKIHGRTIKDDLRFRIEAALF